MDLRKLKELGRLSFGNACRLCPVCDGRACAGEIPGVGGVGSGASFQNNVRDLAAVKLNMTALHPVTTVDCSCELFDEHLAMPVLAAPIGGIAFNWNNFLSEEEYALAIVQGCVEAGVLGMTGDGKLPEIFQSGLRALFTVNGKGIPTIKPRLNADIIALAEKVEEAVEDVVAIAVDVDSAGLINMTAAGQTVETKDYDKLVELRDNIHVPLIIKGIMTVDDALMCADAGMDAIVVSNHGGRVLDHTPGTAKVLPAIAAALYDSDMKILVDGGVQTGFDVLKMLALGADGVLMGRALARAAVGGAAGVKYYLDYVKDQLQTAMLMTGCADLNDVTERIIYEG